MPWYPVAIPYTPLELVTLTFAGNSGFNYSGITETWRLADTFLITVITNGCNLEIYSSLKRMKLL